MTSTQSSSNSTPNYPLDLNKWRKIRVYSMDFRKDLLDMAETTTRLGLWDWFKNYNPPKKDGFMFCGHENVNKISEGLTCNQHSGATFSYAIRNIQYIAKNGFEKWNNIHKEQQQPE